MKTLRYFFRIFDFQTFLVTGLAILSTFLSRRLNLVADLPVELIGLAVVFPLVFSINTAYKMREDALGAFARLKSNATALFFAHRDWAGPMREPENAFDLQKTLLTTIEVYFQTREGPNEQNFTSVFRVFSAYSSANESLRALGVSTDEISRANQYLREMILAFEDMNNIARYRTPRALRAFTRLFLNLFPIIFGPHFANIAYPDFPIMGYVIAGLYGFVLVSLDNVQDHLENPFDGVGPDDLRLNSAEFYGKALMKKAKS